MRNLEARLKEDSINVKDIDLIVITHGHRDHCGSVKELKEFSGAKIVFHKLEKELIGFEADFYLEDKLNTGELELIVFHTPGHSPGSISLYSNVEKFLICGDLIFEGGVGRTDLYGGDVNQLKESLDQVSKLDVEYLLPGHGNIIEGKLRVEQNFLQIKKWFF